MSAPTQTTVRRLRSSLRNYNNCLKQEYFGQVNIYAEDALQCIGDTFVGEYVSMDGQEKFEVRAELVKVYYIFTDEFLKALNWRICQQIHPLTLGEACGFDNHSLKKFIFSFGVFNYKAVGIYIFKNLNYSK